MPLTLDTAWQLTKETFSEYSEDRIPRLAAALAYYAIFSIAPLLVIAIAVAGSVFGEQAARGELQAQLQSVVGARLAQTIESFLGGASEGGGGVVATIVSSIILIIGATSLFAEFQDSLNTIWEVQPKSAGVWNLLRTRFLSFLIVLGIAALLMASLIVSAILTGMAAFVGSGIGYQVINQLGSLLIFTVLFAMVFKWLPDVEIRWSDVWLGAAITAVLFSIGRYLIGLYLARGSVGSVYGAAGSLVALLVWVYYSAQIVLLGAEFTQVYVRRYGQGIQPAAYAEHIPGATRPTVQPSSPSSASAAAIGPARTYPIPPAQLLHGPTAVVTSPQPSAAQRLIPLALGAALGRFVLPQRKPKRPAKPGRRFALTRVFEPGWQSRSENFAQAHPQVTAPFARAYHTLRSNIATLARWRRQKG